MKHKIIRYCILLIVMTALLAGCGKQKRDDNTIMRVGVVLYTQDDPFINALTDCMKQNFEAMESDNLKITMTVRYGRDDQSVQNDAVEEIIDAGCDVLCVDLVDRTAPSKIIEMAKEQDIPVIFFNREPVQEDLMKWDKLYYIGGDAEQSGQMQGEIASDFIKDNPDIDRNKDGKIQYVLLEGEAGHQDAILRTDCAVKTLMDNGIELEKLSYKFADWNRSQAANKMTQLISQYGDSIELVLANNDEMALGVVEAYETKEYKALARPVIFGIDGLNDVLTAIEKNEIQGTVYNDKEGQALKMTELAVDLFKENPLTGYDLQNKKYIYLPYQKVDIQNVSEYIEE